MSILKTRLRRPSVGSRIASGLVDGIAELPDNIMRGAQFAQSRQAQEFDQLMGTAKLMHQRGVLDKDWANTGLRAGELQQRGVDEQGRNRRTQEGNTLALWKALSGQRAQYAPQQYAGALGALRSGDAGAFNDLLTGATSLAEQNRVKEAGRMGGARAGAAARAKSEVSRRDGEEIFQTKRLERGEISALPEGLQVRRDIRKGGKTQEELIADDRRAVAKREIAHVQRLQASEQPIPAAMASRVAAAYLALDPKLGAAYSAADPKTQMLMEADFIENQGWEVE